MNLYRCERLSITTADPNLCAKRRAAYKQPCLGCVDELAAIDERGTEPQTVGADCVRPKEEAIMGEYEKCRTTGCSGTPGARGYCSECWSKLMKAGHAKRKAEKAADLPQRTQRTQRGAAACKTPGCGNPGDCANGYCSECWSTIAKRAAATRYAKKAHTAEGGCATPPAAIRTDHGGDFREARPPFAMAAPEAPRPSSELADAVKNLTQDRALQPFTVQIIGASAVGIATLGEQYAGLDELRRQAVRDSFATAIGRMVLEEFAMGESA